jgi:hypothetical protein
MHLNETEKRMRDGEHGDACELAMTILVELGELYGAERMLEISQVHIDMTLYMVDAGVAFAEKMAGLGGRFAVPTQLNPASIDLIRHERLRVPPTLLEKSRRLENAYLTMGAMPTWTCAPYQQGLTPAFGEQIAWGESNAVAFVNSVIGARTERYANLTDICAAIAGRVPALGLHLDENRKAERLISLEGLPENAFNDARIFALLGFVFGEMAGDRVAALAGMPTPVSMDHLKSFSREPATASKPPFPGNEGTHRYGNKCHLYTAGKVLRSAVVNTTPDQFLGLCGPGHGQHIGQATPAVRGIGCRKGAGFPVWKRIEHGVADDPGTAAGRSGAGGHRQYQNGATACYRTGGGQTCLRQNISHRECKRSRFRPSPNRSFCSNRIPEKRRDDQDCGFTRQVVSVHKQANWVRTRPWVRSEHLSDLLTFLPLRERLSTASPLLPGDRSKNDSVTLAAALMKRSGVCDAGVTSAVRESCGSKFPRQ